MPDIICISCPTQFYLVMKGHGKGDDASRCNGPGKFVAAKVRAAHASLSQSYPAGGAGGQQVRGEGENV